MLMCTPTGLQACEPQPSCDVPVTVGEGVGYGSAAVKITNVSTPGEIGGSFLRGHRSYIGSPLPKTKHKSQNPGP